MNKPSSAPYAGTIRFHRSLSVGKGARPLLMDLEQARFGACAAVALRRRDSRVIAVLDPWPRCRFSAPSRWQRPRPRSVCPRRAGTAWNRSGTHQFDVVSFLWAPRARFNDGAREVDTAVVYRSPEHDRYSLLVARQRILATLSSRPAGAPFCPVP